MCRLFLSFEMAEIVLSQAQEYDDLERAPGHFGCTKSYMRLWMARPSLAWQHLRQMSRLSVTVEDELLRPEAIEFLRRCHRVAAGTRCSANIAPGTADISGRLERAARPIQNCLSVQELDGQ